MPATVEGLPYFGAAGLARPQPQGAFQPMIEPLAADEPTAAQAAVDQALDVARREFEALRAADLADYERRLAERERQLVEETAAALTGQLTAGLRQVGDVVAATVAELLEPFLAAALRERAVAELEEAVAGLLADRGILRVRLKGPADLVERLGGVAAAAGAPVEVEVTDGPDIQVILDDTLVESTVAAWMAVLRGAAAGGADG